jgi:hypothetical protein
MGLDALQSIMSAAVAGLSGYRTPHLGLAVFQRPLVGLPGGTGPRALARTGSSSRELLLPFRVRSRLDPARRPWAPDTCRKVCPSSRHQLAESTDGQGSQALPSRSAHGVSHAPDGLLLRVPCRLVSSRSHVPGSHSKGFSSPSSRTTSSVARALLSLVAGTYRRRIHGTSLLQLASRALIQTATRSRSADGLNLPKLDPLLCFHSLGLFSARLGTAFTAPPLTTFAVNAHCAPSRWSPAYRSAPDLVIHPWTTLPFEIFNLPSSPTEAEHSSEVRRNLNELSPAEPKRSGDLSALTRTRVAPHRVLGDKACPPKHRLVGVCSHVLALEFPQISI